MPPKRLLIKKRKAKLIFSWRKLLSMKCGNVVYTNLPTHHWNVLPASIGLTSILKMEAVGFCQYLVNFYQTTSRHLVKDVKISAFTLSSFRARHVSVVWRDVYYFITQKYDCFIRNIYKLTFRRNTPFVPQKHFGMICWEEFVHRLKILLFPPVHFKD
jgi:hypothetical protein